MKAKCETCLFKDGVDAMTQEGLRQRLLSSSLHCHGTGWPIGTHLCRGARDWQLQILYRMGYLAAPTDEAWADKLLELANA